MLFNFISFFYSPFSSLAIDENYINKRFLYFYYFIYGCFYLSPTIKNPKQLDTEKEGKKLPLFFSLIYFLSCFYGEKTKSQTITKSRKGSQTGAGQGREGLNNACAYACRVGGESTAVFPSPLCFPLNYKYLTLFFCGGE